LTQNTVRAVDGVKKRLILELKENNLKFSLSNAVDKFSNYEVLVLVAALRLLTPAQRYRRNNPHEKIFQCV